MSVTVEQVQAVVDALVDEPREWEYDEATRQLLSYKELLKFRSEVDENAHAALARQMYDRVKVDGNPEFEDQNPKNGRHWLLAAEAAHAILVPNQAEDTVQEAPAPRVFRRGDVIPADVVELEDASGGTLVRGSVEGFGWPCNGRNAGFDWGKNDTSDSLWTGEPFPLTEVLKRDPRKFTRDDQEPTDVKYLRDCEGDLFRYIGPDHWEYKRDNGEWSDMRFRWREVNSKTGATEDLEYTE